MPHPSIAPDSYFWQRTLQLLGEEAETLFCYADAAPVRGVTVNTRLLPTEIFAAQPPFAMEPGGFSAANFRLAEADTRPGLHSWHHAGVYYGQEPSASSAAAALGCGLVIAFWMPVPRPAAKAHSWLRRCREQACW